MDKSTSTELKDLKALIGLFAKQIATCKTFTGGLKHRKQSRHTGLQLLVIALGGKVVYELIRNPTLTFR